MLTIRQVMDTHFEDVKIDRNLCRRITEYAIRFMNRNEDHSAFFGGVLLGVNPIRFHDTDREIWFDDVLRVDDDLLQHDFVKVDHIDPNHMVNSDAFNHIPGYLCYRLHKQNDIPLNIRHEAMVSLFMVLHFKYLTSLLVKRFKYPANKAVAEATFAALNYRFDIKTYGSWHKLIRARAEGIVARGSIYEPFFLGRTDENDYWSSRIVTDTQSRIRELIKLIYEIHKRILDSGQGMIMTSEMAINTDGDRVLKDRTSGYSSYLGYIHQIVSNEDNFIRPELLGVVEKAMPTMPPTLLLESLRYLSRNASQPKMDHLDKFIDECLLYSFDYLQSIRTSVQRNTDLAGLIAKIMAKVKASRTEDARVMFIRETGEAMVAEATKARNPAYLAATRTGLLLYITLRAMTKNYYTR